MRRTVVVTGGSGFIGTNVVEHLLDSGSFDVVNLDLAAPRHPRHVAHWRRVDLRDGDAVDAAVADAAPDAVIHLASRTDLDGATVDDYSVNTAGVAHIITAAGNAGVGRVLFASSQLVCAPGHEPADELDYRPINSYGESKVIGEQLVRERAGEDFTWMLLRPTTIWGPWWGLQYSAFFRAVRAGRYMHPRGVRLAKAFGYVGNTAQQLEALLAAPAASINGRTLYLSDYEPYPVLEWAQEIAAAFGARPVREVPLAVLRGLARSGDLLKRAGMSDPPITSYRLSNMLTPTSFDMAPLRDLCGEPRFSRASGTAATVAWMGGGDQSARTHVGAGG